jgi:hypothetical protein
MIRLDKLPTAKQLLDLYDAEEIVVYVDSTKPFKRKIAKWKSQTRAALGDKAKYHLGKVTITLTNIDVKMMASGNYFLGVKNPIPY